MLRHSARSRSSAFIPASLRDRVSKAESEYSASQRFARPFERSDYEHLFETVARTAAGSGQSGRDMVIKSAEQEINNAVLRSILHIHISGNPRRDFTRSQQVF